MKKVKPTQRAGYISVEWNENNNYISCIGGYAMRDKYSENKNVPVKLGFYDWYLNIEQMGLLLRYTASELFHFKNTTRYYLLYFLVTKRVFSVWIFKILNFHR